MTTPGTTSDLSGAAGMPDDPGEAVAALCRAAAEGAQAVLTEILARFPDTRDQPGPQGRTALMEAAIQGHPGIVRTLLGHGADPGGRAADGTHALYLAAQHGHAALVESLLDLGLPVDLPALKERSALITAAGHGHTDLVRLLLARRADPTRRGADGSHALYWAAQNGHQETVLALLAHDASLINLPGPLARTALVAAAYHGHAWLVELLLERGADPRLADTGGAHALIWAARQGQLATVEILLMRDAGLVDLPGDENETALMTAGTQGHAAVVRILLQAGADPRRSGAGDTQVLHRAALKGDAAVLEVLLAHDPALVDLPGPGGRTALMLAAGEGQTGAVIALLAQGADLRKRAPDGMHALCWAAGEGHTEVIQTLLAQDPQILMLPGLLDLPVLAAACAHGQLEAARLLLSSGADPRQRAGEEGARPLDLAAETGRLEIVESLLTFDPGLLDLPGYRGRTALCTAASKGHLELARRLLAHGADPTLQVSGGARALDAAAMNGHTAVVELLLAQHPHLLNLPGQHEGTALVWAASEGHEAVVSLLLAHGADPRLPTSTGGRALAAAAESGHRAVVERLLAHDPQLLNLAEPGERTALIAAAGWGQPDLVRLFLERGADPRRRALRGVRALDFAASEGYLPIVEALLAHDPELVDLPGLREQSALMAASASGQAAVVSLLLARGADPRKRGEGGVRALDLAAQEGQGEVLALLLAHDPGLLDLPGFEERTALMAAADNKHAALVVELLRRGADAAGRVFNT